MKKVNEKKVKVKMSGGKNGWKKGVFMAEEFFSGFCSCLLLRSLVKWT